MFKIVAVVCFLNIQPNTNLCLYNAQIGRQIEDWETCNQLVDKIVERVDLPFKDKDVAAAFSCLIFFNLLLLQIYNYDNTLLVLRRVGRVVECTSLEN